MKRMRVGFFFIIVASDDGDLTHALAKAIATPLPLTWSYTGAMSLNRTRRAAAADSERSPGEPAGPEDGAGRDEGGGACCCGDRFVL